MNSLLKGGLQVDEENMQREWLKEADNTQTWNSRAISKLHTKSENSTTHKIMRTVELQIC